jgi:hypothetical protein
LRSPSGIKITGEEKINNEISIKKEDEMTDEEDERTIMPNDETTLRTTPTKMKTTTKTIARTLTARISTIIINEITKLETGMINKTIIIATTITTVNTDITYVHAVETIIASRVMTNLEAAAEV